MTTIDELVPAEMNADERNELAFNWIKDSAPNYVLQYLDTLEEQLQDARDNNAWLLQTRLQAQAENGRLRERLTDGAAAMVEADMLQQENAALRERVGELENDLRHGQFVGVFLDSITDTLAHTLWLSDWGMEYADFDEILDPSEPAARSIFNDALAAGFRDCHAVVAKFSFLSGFPDDPDEVVYEGISLPLTHAMYGTPAEQNEKIALAEGGE